MHVRPTWLRRGVALLFSAVVLCTGLACKKSAAQKAADATNYTISGTVNYTRRLLTYDANGVPTGVDTNPANFLVVPARFVSLRIFQYRPQTDPQTQTTTYYWTQVATALTGSDGTYAVSSNILKGYDTFVELVGLLSQSGPTTNIAITADPAGVYSTAQITDRPIYTYRLAVDGTTDPTDPLHSANVSADTTLNFTIGNNDNWLVTSPRWWTPAQTTFPAPPTVPLGSRALAILDTIAEFNVTFGNATPSKAGLEMDIHYRPGVSVKRGNFIERNLNVFATTSYDGSAFHYYGAISGGGTVDGVVQSDDAFDPGVILPLLGRNFMYAQNETNALIPTGVPAPSLPPDLVLVEAFGDAMAAAMLQSPYLPGSVLGNHYAPPRDIRDLSAYSPSQIGPFSAPAITAMTWQMILTNANITGAGTQTLWQANIASQNFLRFFTLLPPTQISGTKVVITDCPNIYTQLARLQEGKGPADNSDLAAYFPDTVLTPLCAQYNITWTNATNAILPQFTTYWGMDPDSQVMPLPSFPLSMGMAQEIDTYSLDAQGVEQVGLAFPNDSRGEVKYAMFALTLDASYQLLVDTVPALPTGAAVEVVIDGDLQNAYLFPAGGPGYAFQLIGNPVDLTTPAWHLVRVRILSPDLATPDVQVTVHLQKVH